MTEQEPTPDPAEVVASLRATVAAIDAGEVDADGAQRAYLTGAADALDDLAESWTSSLGTASDRLL